ncbi:MAG: hypothetical protein WCI11_10250 [Candidatus Methylumidiphilus sp.]
MPRPKLRVTFRSCTPGCPHEAQSWLGEVCCDNEEFANWPDFDDCFRVTFVEGGTTDDTFDFSGSGVPLSFDDFTSEDDVFEIKDCEVVIV